MIETLLPHSQLNEGIEKPKLLELYVFSLAQYFFYFY